MADEYIEREAAIDCLHFVCVPQCRKYAQEEIKKISAVDVQPVRHGRWEREQPHTRHGLGYWNCSECNQLELLRTPFCPNCGAKMDKED